MKLTIFTSDIKKALADLAHFMPGKSSIRELKGVLIRTNNSGNVTLSCTDLSSCLKTTIESIEIEPGETVVDFETINNIVKNCDTARLLLEMKDGKLLVDGFKLPAMDPDDYPHIDTTVPDDLPSAIISANGLKAGLERVEHSSAASNRTVQGFFGVRLKSEHDRFVFASQDGWRLSETTKPAQTLGLVEFKLDGKHAKALTKILSKNSNSVTITRTPDNKMLLTWPGHEAMFVESEGNFMNYEGFFPDENHEQITVCRKDLIAKIKKAGVIVKDCGYQICLMVSKNGMELSAYTENADMHSEVKTTENAMGNNSVHLNGQYVLDALNSLESDKVTLFWEQEESPVYIFSPGNYESDRDVVMGLINKS